MPREFDNSNVTVVDSTPSSDSDSENDSSSGSNSASSNDSNSSGSRGFKTVDELLEDRVGEERAEEIREENQSSNETVQTSSSSSSGSSSKTKPGSENTKKVQLTDVQGEDGFRKTQDQLNKDLKEGNTDNLNLAPNNSSVDTLQEDLATTTQQEKQADVNLSPLQTEDGRQLTEQEARERIKEGRTSNLEAGPKLRTSRSAKIESRENRIENQRQKEQNQGQNQQQNIRSSVPGIDAENIVVGNRKTVLDGAGKRFFNPNQQVDENLDTIAEEAVVAGQGIIKGNVEFGEKTERKLPDELDFFGSGVGGAIAGAEQASQGNIVEGAKTFLTPGNQSDLEAKRSKQVRQGIFAGPGALAGFTLGGLSSVGIAAGNDISRALGTNVDEPGLAESLQGGGKEIIDQFSNNPGEFAAEEAGEEIGEAIARGAVTGGVGTFAVTPNIDPTVTVSTPESLQTSAQFATGNLGLRARDPDTRINLQDTEFVEREFIENPDGEGRAQIVEGFRFTEGGSQLSTGGGVRPETPLSRRQFLKERLGLEEAEIGDFIQSEGSLLSAGGLGAVGLGAATGDLTLTGAGVSTALTGLNVRSPETRPDSKPDNTIDNDRSLFEQPEGPENVLPEKVEVPRPRSIGTVDAGVDSQVDQSLDQGLQQGFNQEEEIVQPPIEQQRNPPINDRKIEQRTEPEPELERVIETRTESIFDPRIDRGRTRLFGDNDNTGFEGSVLQTESSDQSQARAPSLDALVEGQTITEEEAREQEFTGLESRALVVEQEDSSSNLRDNLGI